MNTTVELKQYPDQSAAAIGLDKHNRSKLPNTFEIVQPAKGRDERWITGIDEGSIDVNSITNSKVREERKEELLTLRKDLERATNLDLTATNHAFWQTYKIVLRDTVTLDLANPYHKIQYYVLIANGYAAPELGAINSPEFYNTKYYISRKEEEATGRMVTKKTKDEARAALFNLGKDYNKLVLIGKFLLGSQKIKDGMKDSLIYEELSDFIDDPKDTSNPSRFIEATKKPAEELQYKLVVEEAVRKRVIVIRGKYWQRGNATYGKDLKEVIEYLSSVENANEFASLKEEVESDIL